MWWLRDGSEKRSTRVRINTIIKGEPVLWLIEWKKRELVTGNADAVI